MLYYLHLLKDDFSPFRIFQYITVRTFAGAGTAFLLCVLAGPAVVKLLRRLRIGQVVQAEVEHMHAAKQGTPTMGGVLIIGAMFISCHLWAEPGNLFVHFALATLGYMGLIGFWDDYIKVTRRRAEGLSARQKLGLQFVWAVTIVGALSVYPELGERMRHLMVPFVKDPVIRDLGLAGAMVFVGLILVGSTNAVNLTDGMDGLAIGCSASVSLSYLIMAYVAGHVNFSSYLFVPYVPGSGELAVFCGCMLGASLGFLWYNCHPASVFMGDTGSLALGGSIAMVAILIKQELVLVIVGGVFVLEAVSVILQVTSYKLTGRRIFRMAPIHHHFQKKGWDETQVTVRFWILSVICALVGVLTLKLR